MKPWLEKLPHRLKDSGEQMLQTHLKVFPELYRRGRNLSKVNYDLGLSYIDKQQYRDAILRFRIAKWLHKQNPKAWLKIGYCFMQLGLDQKAEYYLQRALELNPELEEAVFLLKLISDRASIVSLPIKFVGRFFDKAAENYNREMLKNLHYHGHLFIYDEALSYLKGKQFTHIDILDLGCGSGLCGQLFSQRHLVRSMVGVDISPKMLDEARKLTMDDTASYSQLIAQDMVTYLNESTEKFDLILAGLSLHYLGDLKPIFAQISKFLNAEGAFVFTLVTASLSTGFQLDEEQLHFIYDAGYIEDCCTEEGLVITQRKSHHLYEGCDGQVFVITIK